MLILFDIDGTLLHTGGLSKTLFFRAIEETFGVGVDSIDLPWKGLTDYGIAHRLLTANRVPVDDIEAGIPVAFERLGALWSAYGSFEAVTLYPGVSALIDALSRVDSVEIGYYTANCWAGAEQKIAFSNLDQKRDLFVTRLAGDGVHTKLEVLQNQVDQLQIEDRSAWVIGDSPTDIESAHACGLKGMAVTTGFYNWETFSQIKPDVIFENLRDTDRVLLALGLSTF